MARSNTPITLDEIKASLDALRVILLSILSTKNVFNIDELCEYAGLTKSFIYKLTSKREIPFYCPRGKFLYFKRTEIDDWLLQNRIKPISEIESEAANRLVLEGGAKNTKKILPRHSNTVVEVLP